MHTMSPFLRRWALLCLLAFFSVVTLYNVHRVSPLRLPLSSLFAGTSHSITPSPINWKDYSQHYPVPSTIPLPTGVPKPIPRIQYEFGPELVSDRRERLKRRNAVREAFRHSWTGYRRYAWMHDEVRPVSGGYRDHFGGWGATLVDALDSLRLMELEKEFAMAVASLKKIDFTNAGIDILNIFETTIRFLGGLLSAYDMSDAKHPILLEKAIQLGDMLCVAFDTPNRMPATRWYWRHSANHNAQEANAYVLLAEIGSLALEFTRLSQLTGDPKYYDSVQRVTNALEAQQNFTKIPGLWPVALDAATLNFTVAQVFTFGGMADSMYEYLVKEYLMLGGLESQYQTMYEAAIEAAKRHLFFRPMTPEHHDILLSGTAMFDIDGKSQLDPLGQHLTCFVGGAVAVASKIFSRPDDFDVARKLVDGCIWAYNSTLTGIMPELFRVVPCADPNNCDWNKQEWYNKINRVYKAEDERPMPLDERAEMLIQLFHLPPGFTEIKDRKYILRPEAIESLFIMYRITGEKHYQDVAWQMFVNIDRQCRTKISYAAISDVSVDPGPKMDSSESFWMAETLKYLYLIFSDPKVATLDEWVFNTEAHPLRRPRA